MSGLGRGVNVTAFEVVAAASAAAVSLTTATHAGASVKSVIYSQAFPMWCGVVTLCVTVFASVLASCRVAHARGASQGTSEAGLVVGLTLCWLAAPLLASFPPAAALLARVSCPEGFYDPRPLAGEKHGAPGRGGGVMPGGVAYLASMAALDVAGFADVCAVAGTRGVLAGLAMALGAVCLGCWLAWREKRLAGGGFPQSRKRCASIAQGLWGAFWIEMAALAVWFVCVPVIGL